MARGTQYTNVNTYRYTSLQLATGKSVTLPVVLRGNIVSDSLYDDEGVRKYGNL